MFTKYRIAFLILLSILVLAGCAPATTSGLKVGDQAPDFSLQSSTGSSVSLSDFKGKQPVLLFFHMALG